ncbi:MAG: hypothetical protein ACU85E_08270 [Gammaproteobacteria bacterium]
MNDKAEKFGAREETTNSGEKKAIETMTPDQLWERRKSNVRSPSPQLQATDVVPQYVLDMEEEERTNNAWYSPSGDDIDIPPIDPDNPDYQPLTQQMPATEPELEVIPEELRILESQPLPRQSDGISEVPMLGDPEDYLQPDELPPEPAEIEAEPESLQLEESLSGY